MSGGRSLQSLRSSAYSDVPVTADNSRATTLSIANIRQTIQDVVELHTMPEVIFNEPEETNNDTESFKSTEEICNQEECFLFKSIQKPRIHQAYYSTNEKEWGLKESDKDIYLRMIKQVKIAPVSRIVSSLNTSSMELQYYGLDSKQFKPLAEVLMNNTTVRELNLKGNALSVDALYHLGQMLRKNKTIRKLNLQHCKVGPEGAEMLGNGLEICENLNDLDLSYNNLGDEGLEILGIKFGYNSSIRNLNLSHNKLTHKSGFFLAETMEENVSIQNLDLSWNMIAEEQGLKKFLYTTAEQNEGLLKLNLSWNTLGGEKIANIIKNFISQHHTLRELDLSHNKFETVSDVTKIAKGINLAESLKQLNLSYNGITADTAFTMLSSVNGNKAKLQTLYLDNVWVNPEFYKLSKELQSQNGMKVVVQGVIGGVDVKDPDMQTLLLKRANYLGYKPKSKKNKKDFGWFLLRLQNAGTLAPVKKAKFEKLISEDNIKFDDGMIDEFAKKFRNENKRVDLNMMLEKYLLLFPDTALPKPKEKKKPKSPKDNKHPSTEQKLSVGSKKSGKGSLRSSLPKSSLSQPTGEENIEKPSDDLRHSKKLSLQDEKRESYQPEETKEQVGRPSLDGAQSHKRVSFLIDNVNEGGTLVDLEMKAIAETESTVKDDVITDHGVQGHLEGTTDNETVNETSTPAATLETENTVVDENSVLNSATETQLVDNKLSNENELSTENVGTMATEDPTS